MLSTSLPSTFDSPLQSPATTASSLESDFGSVHSRSTTPSSEAGTGNPPHSVSYSHELVWVSFSDAQPNVRLLGMIFAKFATEGQLGLILPCEGAHGPPQFLNQYGKWEQISIASDFELWNISVLRRAHFPFESKPVICPSSNYAQQLSLLSLTGLRSMLCFPSQCGSYLLHIVEQPMFVFPPMSCTPGLVTGTNIPTLNEWRNLWAAWDMVTLGMIPQEMLHQKPIDLRHKCLFYIGHIPTFLDMLLSKAIGGGASEPKYFWNIFERGIDPHVDDPDHCHNHSDVPEKDEDWPTLDAILAFRSRVRGRLIQLYSDLESGNRVLNRNIARTLLMTLEHEGFHVETILYMLIQRAGTGTLPPPGFSTPQWSLLASQWNTIPPPSSHILTLGPSTITTGHYDSEGDDADPDSQNKIQGTFGWDNESPERTVQVQRFNIEWRPVTNGEFLRFMTGIGHGKVQAPASWVEESGDYMVRSVYGPLPMSVAQHWPVLTSYDDLDTYARSRGGRLPTEFELRLFLDLYDVGYEGGANSGFRNWHPVPATTGLAEYGCKGSNGGVWEWTSTAFDGHDGLIPTKLFPGYSTDFFDQKHHVVLGASYVTIPRLGRRTLRNFYQHNYPYAWVGGRVVYEL